MTYSYKQLVQYFEPFCASHYGIKRFYSTVEEQIQNVVTPEDSFPVVTMTPISSVLGDTIRHSVRVSVWDRIAKDRTNEGDITSDLQSILNDIRMWFGPDNDLFSQIVITSDPTAYPQNNRLLDFCYGWSMDIQIDMENYGFCSIPLDGAISPLPNLPQFPVEPLGFSGVSGYSGFSGFSGIGISGYSGFSGATGKSGDSGFSGIGTSGYSGMSGKNGFNGASGFSGVSGKNGLVGTSGFSGVSGFSGIGTSGFSGIGISGVSGFSGIGASGFSGVSGFSGIGTSGFSGVSGFSGIGTSGFSGFSGVNGISGFSGGGTDTNFANTDLTFTADRFHDADGFQLNIENTPHFHISSPTGNACRMIIDGLNATDPKILSFRTTNLQRFAVRVDGANDDIALRCYDNTGTFTIAPIKIERATGQVEISEAYTLPLTDGTANQVLKTDGAGNTSWTTQTTIFTVELIDVVTLDFYAPFNMTIDSVTNLVNVPTTTLLDDGVAYTLGATIIAGSKVTVTVNTAAVINLNATKL